MKLGMWTTNKMIDESRLPLKLLKTRSREKSSLQEAGREVKWKRMNTPQSQSIREERNS